MKRATYGITFLLTTVMALLVLLQDRSSADLVLSVDASNSDFLTLDGTNVTQWRQEFGATAYIPFTLDPEGLSSEAPTFNPSGLNGLSTVDFFSAEFDFLLADIGTLIRGNTDEYSIFFVADAKEGNGTPFSQQAFSTNGSLSFRNTSNWNMRIGGSAGGPGGNGFFDSGDPTNSGFKVRSVIGDATSVTWDIGGTSTVIGDTDHAIRAPGFFTLGNRFSPFNHPANVSIAQLAIFDTALDADTRTGINSILADKWGLPAIVATPQQLQLGMTALTQPAAEPPPPPIALYEFTNGTTSGTIDSVDSTDDELNSIASEWTTGGAVLVSTCCGNPDRGAFFGGGGWRSIGEIGPGIPSTVSSFAPEDEQTPTVDEGYFAFTVLPNEGFQMDLEQVTFDLQRDSIDGLNSWGVYADEDPGEGGDNFSTKLGGETGADVPPGGVRDYHNFQIDVSEFAFLQNVTDATTFRIYFWHDGEYSNDVWLADEQAGMGGTELNRTSTRLDNVSLLGIVGEISEGLAGDYNDDGVVDAADYSVWRDNLGAAAGTLLNDVDGGVIGTDQYNTWVANFGNTNGSGSASGAAVPEPSVVSLIAIGCACMASVWLKRYHQFFARTLA